MKTCVWAVLVGVIGWTIGALVALAQFDIGSATGPVSSDHTAQPGTTCCPGIEEPTAHEGQPKIVVDQEVFDFGVMSSEDEGKKHDFTIQNEGQAILEIEGGATGCKCAIAKLEKKRIAPGDKGLVTMEWDAKGFFGPYEQIATLNTNDPRRPKVALKVKGRITNPARANPAEVVFSNLTANHSAQATVNVFCYKSKDFKITEMEIMDPETAEFFAVSAEPLSPEQLGREADALAGYEVEIVAKPGLPVGPFLQTILVRTSLPQAPRIEIPVKGKVGSDISIVGRDWDEGRRMLRLGILDPAEDTERTLLLVVRGRHRHHVDFEVAEVSPSDIIQAELEKEIGTKKGIAIRVPLKIRIPKNAGPANYLGAGQGPVGHILIETTHPEIPRIKIPISFAIEGG